MQWYFTQIGRRAQWSARRTGRFAVGLALLFVSFGFLTAAVWVYLATEFSPILASLACSGVFFVAAGGFFLMASGEEQPVVPPFSEALKTEFQSRTASAPGQSAAPGARPPLLDAFLTGFETYARYHKK